jgi:hypothetical protein
MRGGRPGRDRRRTWARETRIAWASGACDVPAVSNVASNEPRRTSRFWASSLSRAEAETPVFMGTWRALAALGGGATSD